MSRWRGWLLGVLALLGAPRAEAAIVESLRESGPAADRFNIAVLGDGYRAEDQSKLESDAQGIIDHVFSVAPLREYAGFFNVKLVHVISNENGADNGRYGATRDTALGAYFSCDGIDRLLCIDDGKAQVAAAQDVPEYNFAIVIVNDPKYGGSGGAICAASSNQQSFDILAHEVGHSLAHLADEYSYEGNQPPCSPQRDCQEANATLRTNLEQIKWHDWIETGTPLPTPDTAQYASVTGLFEGARYTPTGLYRPQQNCKMRDLAAGYCSVCTEQFVRSIWSSDNIKMVEASLPEAPTVQSTTCEPIALSVTSPPIQPSTYRYIWTVDGKARAENTRSVSLSPRALGEGEHQVAVRVEDATSMVRTDLDNILKDQVSWTVSVGNADCQVGGADADGGEGGASGGVGGAAGAGGGGTAGGAGDLAAPSGGGSGVGGGGANDGAAAGMSPSGGRAVTAGAPPRTPPPRETAGCGCAVASRTSREGLAALFAALGTVLGRRRGSRSRRVGWRSRSAVES